MRAARAIAALLLVLAASSVATGARRPARGGTVRLPTEGPIGTNDPVQSIWPGETLLVSLLYDAPYRIGREGHPRPHLLTVPAAGADSRTFRVRIRRNAVFHDGTPVTAEHVVASLGRLAASRRSGWVLAMIEGTAPGERRPAGLRSVGDQFIEIRLRSERDLPVLLAALTTPQAGIIRSPATVTRGVGTGPFSLRRTSGGDRQLRANRDYFGGPPYLDGVTLLGPVGRDDHIRRFQLGRAEGSLLGDSVYGERAEGRVDQTRGARSLRTCLVLNGSKGATRDVRLRRAVDLAVSRDRLAGGTARAAGYPGDKAAARRDLGRARRELEARGGPPGGRPLVLLVDGDDPFGAAVAPLLLRDLAEVGLSAEPVVVRGGAARARLTSGSWDLRLVTVAPSSADHALQMGQLLALGGLSADASRLVRDVGGDRRAAVARARATLDAQRLVLPLVIRSPRMHHRPRLRGVFFDVLGRLRAEDLWLRPEASGGGGTR